MKNEELVHWHNIKPVQFDSLAGCQMTALLQHVCHLYMSPDVALMLIPSSSPDNQLLPETTSSLFYPNNALVVDQNKADGPLVAKRHLLLVLEFFKSERVLTRVSYVKESILILVLLVDRAHQSSSWWENFINKDENSLLW